MIALITTLARYQTDFWVRVGHALHKKGQSVAFLSFDDRSTAVLQAHGFRVFTKDENDYTRAQEFTASFEDTIAYYGISDINFWLAHERITFDIGDGNSIKHRLLLYLAMADRACTALKAEDRVVMIQELGGFVSVVACYFAARHHGMDNWFIEPSFFRGRLFFLKNSFAAKRITHMPVDEACSEVRGYLKRTLENKDIVVPLKDRHQYTTAFRKVINWRNLKRLGEKIVDKYLLGKHMEFGHIGTHVSRHMNMLANSFRLRGCYTPIQAIGPFVYYPLHVPADMALTLRSPQFLDQLALIDYLARTIPHTHKLAVKEHPAMIGAVDASRLKRLLNRYDNLALINPGTNNYEVLQLCDAVISVNSKSGAEALLLGKPVVVLGDAFYRDSPLATPVESVTALSEALKRELSVKRECDTVSIENYFEQVWQCTYGGELYVNGEDNIQIFTDSLIKGLSLDTPAATPI